MKVFHLPDLGEGLQEAEIVTWHVVEGDRVVADQPLVSVETDKAVVEVPSPHSGVITSLNAKEGEIIAVGTLLVEYAEEEVQRDAGTVVGSVAPEEPDDSGKSVPTKLAAARRPVGRAKASPAVRTLARKLAGGAGDDHAERVPWKRNLRGCPAGCSGQHWCSCCRAGRAVAGYAPSYGSADE